MHSTGFISAEFKLYPKNPCENLFKGPTLKIHVLPCPTGFNLSDKDSRCVCDKKLKKFVQNCYIDSDSESVECMKNNFWICKASNEILLLHEFHCSLDFCINNQLNMSLSDPSTQCELNRNGILCGQCQKNSTLA